MKCQHGFESCYSCKVEYIHPTDCHSPGCEDRKQSGEKFCPKHHGKFSKHFKAED